MAESVIQAVAGKIVDYLAVLLQKQVSYICCYSCNVKTLANELGELNIKHEDVQRNVDAARADFKVISSEVEAWLKKVEELKSRIVKICGDAEEIQRSSAYKWFPLLHYSLSRKAFKAVKDSIKLRNTNLDQIFNRKNPAEIAPVPSTSNVGFKSRDLIEGRIMDALRDPSVYSIGIWGIGGVGKTVMAKKIAENVHNEKSLFEHVVMVVVSQQPDLQKIQNQIAEGLSLTLSEVSPFNRQKKLHARLEAEKSILIILDDLWERLDLEELGIPSQSSHAGCKLILTSRNRDALTSTGVPVPNIFNLEVLTEEESWKFFKDCTSIIDDDSHDDLVQIAKKVEGECMRLPLALKIVGCALRGRDKSFWDNAVRELEKSVPDNIPDVIEHVYRPLLYSINALQGKEQKDLFLLCCLFPEDYSISIEELLRCGVGLRIFKGSENLTLVRDKVETLLKILLSRSLLIEQTEISDDFYVRMHDVIRDVGIWIAKEEGMVGSNKEKHIFMISHGEEGWPMTEEDSHSNYTCISLLFSRHNISFPESIDCPKLEFLRLDLVQSTDRKRYIKLPENFFNGMSGLKVLEALHMEVFPPSVGQLNNLRTLFLQDCKFFETATVLGKLVNLEILSFRGCEFVVLPMEIGGLKKLKKMDISYCRFVRVAFGVVSGLVRLEELVMLGSFSNWEAEAGRENHNACLSELNGLKNLTTLKIEIRNPSVVPRQKPLWVQKVKKYDMTVSKSSYDYEKERFHKAILLGEVVNPLGDWIYDMARHAEFLYLEGSNCMTVMKGLSQYSGYFSCLKQLRLCNFTNIRYLAEGQQNGAIFPMLESLHIYNSDSLQQISDVSLPTGSFVALQSICLDGLSGLMCLWKFSIQGQLYLRNLTMLSISYCSKLAYLFSLSIAQSLVQLSRLNIDDCRTMKEIFKKEDGELVEINDIKLPKLSSISLWNLNSFCRLCNGIDSVELPELRRLYFHNLPSIKMMEGDNNEVLQQYLIPKAAGNQVAGTNFNFCGLGTLKVKGIGNFKCMFPPSVISGAPNLRELEVEFCSMLEHVIGNDDKNIEEMILFPNLRELRLSNLPNILTFCYNDIQLPSLEQLYINQCPMMLKFVEELPKHTSNTRPFINKQVQCPNLKSLILYKLNISGMFSSLSFKSLTNLERLYISDCKELEYMIIEEGQTVEREFIQRVSLKNFHLIKLPKLYGYVFQMKHCLEFPLLEEIKIEDCPLLKKFACGSLHLPKLKWVIGLLNIEVAANFFFHKEMSFPEIQLKNNCFILSIKDISFSYDNSISDNGLGFLTPDSSEIFVNAISFAMGAQIVGKFKPKKIHTGTNYEIMLMIMLGKDASWGEGELPVEIELKLPGGSKLHRTEFLENQPREIWTEISLGKFVIREPQHISETLEFSLRPEFSWMDSDKRLSIKGVRIVEV